MAASGFTRGSPHSRETNQRLALSRLTVTVVGTAPSGRGSDQAMSNGSAVFASVRRQLRKRKAALRTHPKVRDSSAACASVGFNRLVHAVADGQGLLGTATQRR